MEEKTNKAKLEIFKFYENRLNCKTIVLTKLAEIVPSMEIQ